MADYLNNALKGLFALEPQPSNALGSYLGSFGDVFGTVAPRTGAGAALGQSSDMTAIIAALQNPPAAKPATRTYPCYELFVDNAGEWRWHTLAANGLKIADSAEGYKRVEDAEHGIALMEEGRWPPRPTYIGRR